MRKTAILGFVFALFYAAVAHAGPFQAKDWEISLSGSGVTPADGDSFTTQANVGLGYFVTDALEIWLRQGVAYTDTSDNHWFGVTTLAADWNFALNDKFVIAPGAFAAVQYGDGLTASWQAGPECFLKYLVTPSSIIFFGASYGFDLSNGDNDGSFIYQLGVEFKI